MSKFKHKNVTSYSDEAERNIVGGGSAPDPIIDLKASEETKYAEDCQWFKDYCDFLVPPSNTLIPEYKKLKDSYDIINNNLDSFKSGLENFCNPMGLNIDEIKEEIQPYPVLHNNINILKGELIKRRDNLHVSLLSASAIKEKNEELKQETMRRVSEELAVELKAQEMQLSQMPKEEVSKFVEEMRKNLTPIDADIKDFKSEFESFLNHALRFGVLTQNVPFKKVDTFEDALIADRCFIHSGWKYGKPVLEVWNTLHTGFEKPPNEFRIEKGDAIWYQDVITPTQLLSEYGNDLDSEELKSLGLDKHHRNNRVDSRHDVLGGTAVPVFDHINEEMNRMMVEREDSEIYNEEVGMHQTMNHSGTGKTHRFINRVRIEFKAFKEIIFLSYIDDYNNPITTLVSNKFEIPEDAREIKFINKFGEESIKKVWEEDGTEFSTESLHIPRRYEATRLDNIYVRCREVPFQPLNLERPFSSFELSTKGAVFTSKNSDSVSLVQRAFPAYMQYLFVKHIQNRELSKYQGAIQSIDVDQIPDDLGNDLYGNNIRDKVAVYLLYLQRTNKDFYSGSQSSTHGLPPATRSPGSSGYTLGTAVELMNLQQMVDLLEVEVGMAMGISPQRKAMFSNNSNVADNQQSITQSHHITEPYHFLHSEVWKNALQDYIQNFRTYCEMYFESNPTEATLNIEYVLPEGVKELFKVTPKMLSLYDFGLYVSNNINSMEYIEMMKQLAHSFGQNAGEGMTAVSTLVKAITSGVSPEETHKLIQLEEKRQQDRLAAMQQAQAESQERIAQMSIENREDIQKHELEKITVKALLDRETRLREATLVATGMSNGEDTDQDGIPEALEVYKILNEQENKKIEQEQQNRALDQKDRDLDIKETKVKQDKNKPAKSS